MIIVNAWSFLSRFVIDLNQYKHVFEHYDEQMHVHNCLVICKDFDN